MIEVIPTADMIREAQIESQSLGSLNGSITRGRGNVYGYIGEFLVADLIGAEIQRTYDFDIVKDGITFDVKTKHCTSVPQNHYLCSVADFNTRQKCCYYTFVRVLKDFSCAWILGSILKEEFYRLAVFRRKGEIDPDSHLEWDFKADCYNLPITYLKPFSRMLSSKYATVAQK